MHFTRQAGGVTLDDRYKLPTDFLTETEYGATMYALECAYAQTAQSEFLQAKQKIAASYKPQNDELFDMEANA